MEHIEINTLGELKIFIDGVDIVQPFRSSRKKTNLLGYLIVNQNRLVLVSELAEVLWPSAGYRSVENTLKTLVSRLRKDLEPYDLNNAIVTKPGAYMWSVDVECCVDIVRLEELHCKISDVEQLTNETGAFFEEVMSLYSDDMLANSDMGSWIAPKSIYYRNIYMQAMYKYTKLLDKEKRYIDVIRVCKCTLDIDAFNTEMNVELMRALLKIGKSQDALEQYENFTGLQYTHLGMKPSEELLDVYHQIIHASNNASMNIEHSQQELMKGNESEGAMYCEYTAFREIYNLQVSNMKRMDTPMYLALTEVRRQDDKPIQPIEMDQVMKRLLSVLKEGLRRGDTIARYSPLQYVVLLPTVSNDKLGNSVMDRMKARFYNDSDNVRYVLNHRVSQIL